jgi:hypothetical protein
MQLLACDPANKLALAFNKYLAALAPAAEALAPNQLSLRQYHCVSGSDAYHEAACLNYKLHIVAGALVRLHACYIEATARLEHFATHQALGLEAYQAEHGSLRDALAPLFAGLPNTTEAIGGAHPEHLFSPAEWGDHASKIARRLGLNGVPRPRFGSKQTDTTSHVAVQAVLREGQILAADFLVAEEAPAYLHLLRRLTQVQQLKNMGILA